MQYCSSLIKVQFGAATLTKKLCLMEDAKTNCALITDHSFLDGLEHVVGNIEPICYGTNINQKDSTHADQVLLTLVGMYLHFHNHPIPEVVTRMIRRLEKRWKDCDQSLFLLAVILNPFEGLSCFREQAGMNHFKYNNLRIQVFVHCL